MEAHSTFVNNLVISKYHQASAPTRKKNTYCTFKAPFLLLLVSSHKPGQTGPTVIPQPQRGALLKAVTVAVTSLPHLSMD